MHEPTSSFESVAGITRAGVLISKFAIALQAFHSVPSGLRNHTATPVIRDFSSVWILIEKYLL